MFTANKSNQKILIALKNDAGNISVNKKEMCSESIELSLQLNEMRRNEVQSELLQLVSKKLFLAFLTSLEFI